MLVVHKTRVTTQLCMQMTGNHHGIYFCTIPLKTAFCLNSKSLPWKPSCMYPPHLFLCLGFTSWSFYTLMYHHSPKLKQSRHLQGQRATLAHNWQDISVPGPDWIHKQRVCNRKLGCAWFNNTNLPMLYFHSNPEAFHGVQLGLPARFFEDDKLLEAFQHLFCYLPNWQKWKQNGRGTAGSSLVTPDPTISPMLKKLPLEKSL